jgi:hypothetical protein
MRRSSMRKRLEHLEAIRQTQASTTSRQAWVEICHGNCAETHVVLTCDVDDTRWYFQELPDPGKQLADFGRFSLVMHLSSDEMRF